nr:hypothetical protein [Tanacetum cinerariifolium]
MSSAFADTHNMVAILTKSDASEGFDQILDFLNGSYIKYALTVNPHIYVSCIKQFWNTIAVKQSANVTRLQALVDKKKVLISKAVIRDVLRLDDAEGVDCLPNEEIFTGLARMGYEKPSTKLTFYKALFSIQWKFLIHTILQSLSAKRTSWNEFSSAMASAIICLSTAEEIEEQNDAEEQIQGNDNDARGADADVLGDDVQDQFIPSPAPPTSPPPPQDIPSTSHGRMIDELDRDEGIALMGEKEEEKKAKEVKVISDDAQVEGRQAEIQAKIYHIDMDHPSIVLSMHEEESTEVHEVVEVVTTAKLITEVVTAASAPVSAVSKIIPAAEPNIPAVTITTAPVKVAAASTRQRKGVVIRDPEEESSAITPAKTKDKGKSIMAEEPKPMKKKQQVEMHEAYARKLHEELNQDIDWDVTMDHIGFFKGMSYDDIRLIFETKFNANMEFLLKSKEKIEEEANRALKSINETPAQKAVKRRRSLKKNTKCFNAAGEELNAVKHKLMLLDTTAEGRVNTAK